MVGKNLNLKAFSLKEKFPRTLSRDVASEPEIFPDSDEEAEPAQAQDLPAPFMSEVGVLWQIFLFTAYCLGRTLCGRCAHGPVRRPEPHAGHPTACEAPADLRLNLLWLGRGRDGRRQLERVPGPGPGPPSNSEGGGIFGARCVSCLQASKSCGNLLKHREASTKTSFATRVRWALMGKRGSAAAPGSGRVNLQQLLSRPCVCLKRECFKQFKGLEDRVKEVRKEFHGLPREKKDARTLLDSYFLSWFAFSFCVCMLRIPKESWLTSVFNCQHQGLVDLGQSRAQDPGPDETFECSSEGSRLSASNEDEVFYSSDSDQRGEQASSHGEVFYASGSEPEVVDQRPAKRQRYNGRRSDKCVFLGLEVCVGAYARLLAVGTSTLQKIRRGEPAFTNNVREPLAKHPQFGFSYRGECGQRWQDILMFLWFVYQSSAEVLPTGYMNPVKGKLLESPFPEEDPEAPDKQDERLRIMNSIARTINTCSTDVDVHLIGPGTFSGPRRSLMHATKSDLYFEYQAFAECRQLRQASQSTFLRVAKAVLAPRAGHLRFRKASEHSTCDTCFKLRERIRLARNSETKSEAQRDLHSHLLQQWLDRQVYWSFRSMSQSYFSALLRMNETLSMPSNVALSMLCVIQDGMTQAKFRIPRVRQSQKQTKLFQKLFRPQLHVSACWAHGHAVNVAVSDEDLAKDSETQVEILCRALDDILAQKSALPHGLNIQADNTYRETKNQFFMAWAMMGVALGLFRHITCSFLKTGHSHAVATFSMF